MSIVINGYYKLSKNNVNIMAWHGPCVFHTLIVIIICDQVDIHLSPNFHSPYECHS